MIDRDLAALYGVSTGVLNQAVRRNIQRFPNDFMFRMDAEEFRNWVSQIVIPNRKKMGIRLFPYVFTEQGIAMLSSVLRSERAIMVNVQIIRTFMKMRTLITDHHQLHQKLELMEKQYDEQFKIVFVAIRKLMEEEQTPKTEIGFKTP